MRLVLPGLASCATLLLAATAPAQRAPGEVVRVRDLDAAPAALLEAGASPRAPAARSRLQRADLLLGERPAIMLTGYWPPSNEAIRHFSPDPVQNPDGWQGSDWEGRGYDVHAYFPEFVPPDCDDCGQGAGDLEVDYQDTSLDFWPLADALAPIAIMTFSRGFDDGSWEVEMNQFNKQVWFGDFTSPLVPTPSPPDASVPANTLRPSTLPVQAIVDAVAALPGEIDPFICFTGDGGGFLSEFIAYHGVWYQDLHADPADPAWCIAAGHVHVGGTIPDDRARLAAEASLRALIELLDATIPNGVCQTDVGFGGPGTATLTMCGDPLETGGLAEVRLQGAAPNAPAFFLIGTSLSPAAVKGGTLASVPAALVVPAATDADGAIVVPDVPGGGGPATGYLQAVYADAAQAQGVGFSNALELAVGP